MNPAARYFETLAPTGRRSIRQRYRWAADQVGQDWAEWIPTPEQVERLRAEMMTRKMAPATSSLTLAALKGVARSAHRLRMISTDDLQRIQEVQPVKGSRELAGRMLNLEEVWKVLETLPDTPQGRRDGAIFGLCFFGGLRRSEAVALQYPNAIKSRVLHVIGKANKARRVPINQSLNELLNRYIEHRGRKHGPLLLPANNSLRFIDNSTIAKRCRYIYERAGVDRFSAHDLRRSFISYLLDAGVDLATAQRLAGHASPVTTAAYDRRPEQAAAQAVAIMCRFINDRASEKLECKTME